MANTERKQSCELERRMSTLLSYMFITMCGGGGLAGYFTLSYLPSKNILDHPIPFVLLVVGVVLFMQSIALLCWLVSD